MIDSPYQFRKASVNRELVKPHVTSLTTYVFHLDDMKRKVIYIVEIEEYDFDLHVIKYYPKSLKNHKLKFNLLTKQAKAGRIIATCLHIILDFIKRKPRANIGFIGARITDLHGNFSEGVRLTKRFRIYSQVFQDFFGTTTYEHLSDINTSTYLLVNKRHDVPAVAKGIQEMLVRVYPDLFST